MGFLANLATFLGFGLAIWAYFFTSLPDDIARQFRTEIADQKEELADLRQQRRKLEGQVDEAQHNLATVADAKVSADQEFKSASDKLQAEIAAIQAQKESAQNQLDQTKTALAAIRKDKATYVRDLVFIRIEAAIATMLPETKSLENLANMAVDYPAYKLWRAKGDSIGKLDRDSAEAFEAWTEAFRKWLAERPKSWTFWELFHSPWNRDLSQDELAKSAVMEPEEAFLDAISVAKSSVTGRSLLQQFVVKFDYGRFTPADRKKLTGAVEYFINSHSAALDRRLSVTVDKSATAEQIAEIGAKAAASLAEFKRLIATMPAEVSSKFVD